MGTAFNDLTPVVIVVYENADPMRQFGIYNVVKVIDTTWGNTNSITRAFYNDPNNAGRYQLIIFRKPVNLGFFDILGEVRS